MIMRQQGKYLAIALSLLAASGPLFAQQDNSVFGDWKEAGGSVIRIAPCGTLVCATLVAISPKAPTDQDGKNPERTLRNRPLCGLKIGEGFHAVPPSRAEEGTLYDPKSGKTYKGNMEVHGSQLSLRGYVGIPLFGRTETWDRTSPVSHPCAR